MEKRSRQRTRYSPDSIETLVSALSSLRARQPKAISSTIHVYPPPIGKDEQNLSHEEALSDGAAAGKATAERYVTSWKMSEHLYRRKDCPFPTLARGLFIAAEDYSLETPRDTSKIRTEAGSGTENEQQRRAYDLALEVSPDHKIVARGYDKFFNVGEVEWTEWDNLALHSQPPYDLTYKSNGCLILISAISPSELIVSSKHSLGTTVVGKDTPEPVVGDDPAEKGAATGASPAEGLPVEVEMMGLNITDPTGGPGANGTPGLPSSSPDSHRGTYTAHAQESTPRPAFSQDSNATTGSFATNHPPNHPSDHRGENTFDGSATPPASSSAIMNAGGQRPNASNAMANPNSKKSQKKAEKKQYQAKKRESIAEIGRVDKGQSAAANTKSAATPFGSTTECEQPSKNHAEMGRSWVAKTLDRAGKTESELARVLWDRKLSAVAELCDDEFEEHVLAIPEHLTGLHLHGLNANTPHFATLPPADVEDFARAWGFIPTPSIRLESLDEVREYTDRVGKDGRWRGEAIEGFVVRTVVRDIAGASESSEREAGVIEDENSPQDQVVGEPPYPPGSPFFFKIKFDEPYLMYRQWREITRTLLPLLNEKCTGRKSRKAPPWTKMGHKLKRPESAVYADWCAQAMVDEPALFANYETGVIRVRERFLAWTATAGKETWRAARLASEAKSTEQEATGVVKAIVVPVGVPGTGKTLLGVALSRLFGMAHTQSDDVTTKRSAPAFLKNIEDLLAKNDVVYCDRNNHLPKHHDELVELAIGLSGERDVRRIALLFDVDHHPYNRALALTSERVLSRGENHQSLRPDPADQLRHEQVIRQFLNEFVPPEGGLFDTTIKLKLGATLRENLQTACVGLSKALRVPMPNAGEIDAALSAALGYKPTVRKDMEGQESPATRYYGLAMEMDLQYAVLKALKTAKGADPSRLDAARSFLDLLVSRSRITTRPHITIVHEKSVAAEREERDLPAAEAEPRDDDARKDVMVAELGGTTGTQTIVGPQERLWNECAALGRVSKPARFRFDLTALVWDDRLMTLVVENVRPALEAKPESGVDTELARVERALCEDLKDVLHVTVGTRDESIAPFEARGLVARWRQAATKGGGEDANKVGWIDLQGISDSGRVMGMY